MAQCSRGLGMVLRGMVLRRFVSSTGGSTVTHIPAYKPSTGSSLSVGNQVPANQNFFQIRGNDQLVFLRGSNDKLIYRGFMTVALGGIGVTLFCLYKMAVGTMPKKERTG